MLLAAMRSIVLANANVTNKISTKLYPTALPQGQTIPAADMRVVTTTAEHHLLGTLQFYTSNVTIDCYAYESKTADEIAMAILEPTVVDFRGVQDGVDIRGIDIVSGLTQSHEGYDPGSNKLRYVTSVTLQVSWTNI